jgi:hypothetical protein
LASWTIGNTVPQLPDVPQAARQALDRQGAARGGADGDRAQSLTLVVPNRLRRRSPTSPQAYARPASRNRAVPAADANSAEARGKLARLRAELSRVASIDFFGSDGRETIEGLVAGLERRLRDTGQDSAFAGEAVRRDSGVARRRGRQASWRAGLLGGKAPDADQLACLQRRQIWGCAWPAAGSAATSIASAWRPVVGRASCSKRRARAACSRLVWCHKPK